MPKWQNFAKPGHTAGMTQFIPNLSLLRLTLDTFLFQPDRVSDQQLETVFVHRQDLQKRLVMSAFILFCSGEM